MSAVTIDMLHLLKTAFAEAWCISEHEYHQPAEDVPCRTARRVAGLEIGGSGLIENFVVALDVARFWGVPTYVHLNGVALDGCSDCLDDQLVEEMATGQSRPRILCRQPAPDPNDLSRCRWCAHPVGVGEDKWTDPATRGERVARLRSRHTPEAA